MSLTPEQVVAYCIDRVDQGFVIDILNGYTKQRIDTVLDYLVLNEPAIVDEYSQREFNRLIDTVKIARYGRLP